jgi:hypothetical protein
LLPAVLVIGSTLGFVALAAPRWTHQVRVPAAIAVRPDAMPSQAQPPAALVASARHHHHHPDPTASPSAPAPTGEVTTVTVVQPMRPVVTAHPKDDNASADGKYDNSESNDGSNGAPDR